MKKIDEVKGKYDAVERSITKSIRMTPGDSVRLQRLRSLFSPYAPLSEGKAISVALELAELAEKKVNYILDTPNKERT